MKRIDEEAIGAYAEVDWSEVGQLLDTLYSAIDRLEELFPDRKFTLDGHLVGSIGEVLAAYMFDLDHLRGGTKGHDATTQDKRNVEIKLTQGDDVGIRYEPEYLIVLQRKRGNSVDVVFNGPGKTVWTSAGKLQKNGQRKISTRKLRELNEQISQCARLPAKRTAPI
jgi:hypothetical protein